MSGEGRGGAKGRGPKPSSNAAHLPPLLGSRSYYEARVDADLAAFRGANAGMAATGSFKEGTSKEALLRAVACCRRVVEGSIACRVEYSMPLDCKPVKLLEAIEAQATGSCSGIVQQTIMQCGVV